VKKKFQFSWELPKEGATVGESKPIYYDKDGKRELAGYSNVGGEGVNPPPSKKWRLRRINGRTTVSDWVRLQRDGLIYLYTPSREEIAGLEEHVRKYFGGDVDYEAARVRRGKKETTWRIQPLPPAPTVKPLPTIH
jgi:hypothetical protein